MNKVWFAPLISLSKETVPIMFIPAHLLSSNSFLPYLFKWKWSIHTINYVYRPGNYLSKQLSIFLED